MRNRGTTCFTSHQHSPTSLVPLRPPAAAFLRQARPGPSPDFDLMSRALVLLDTFLEDAIMVGALLFGHGPWPGASLPCRSPSLNLRDHTSCTGTHAAGNKIQPMTIDFSARPRCSPAQVDRSVYLHRDLNALAGLVGLCRGRFQPDLCGLDLRLGRSSGFL